MLHRMTLCDFHLHSVQELQHWKDWDSMKAGCPLVEVETPHGRLIDVKAMENLINEQGLIKRSWNICADVALNKTMTVIEAEGE